MAFFVGVPFSIATGFVASSPNKTVTLGALGLLVSSAFQFAGAAQVSFGSVPVGSENRKKRFSLTFLAVLVLSVVLILFGVFDVFPPFFVENVGVTFIDYAVYGLVVLFFLAGSLLYFRLYLKVKTDLLYIYSLGLLLYGIGCFGITQQVVFGDAIVWIGRIATYFGLLYFLLALVGSRQESSTK